jgi:hypothetical protein
MNPRENFIMGATYFVSPPNVLSVTKPRRFTGSGHVACTEVSGQCVLLGNQKV